MWFFKKKDKEFKDIKGCNEQTIKELTDGKGEK